MKQLELLAAKPVTKAAATQVVCSVITTGGTYRLRIAITTSDFKDLFLDSSAAPKSNIYGDAGSGLLVLFSANQGLGVSQMSKDVVGISVSAKQIGATENKVERSRVPASIAQYADGSRALFIAPLPDNFLSTTSRKKRHAPPSALLDAFSVADIDVPVYGVAKVVETPAQTVAAVAPVVAPPPIEKKVVPLQDLKDLLEMCNTLVEEFRATGANVTLRVEDGRIRGKIVREEEL